MIRMEYPKANIEGLSTEEKVIAVKRQLDMLTNNVQLVLESINGDLEGIIEYIGGVPDEGVDTVTSVVDRVDAVEKTVGDIEDYIIEEGTDGIWTYRKWNSGIAECWGLATASSLTWVSYLSTGLYYTNPNWEIDFPFAILNPRVNANIVKTGGNVGWVANANYSSEKAFLSVVRNGNSGETSVSITVKGRWK